MSTTMRMGIGTNTDRPDEGALRGRQIPVACSAWFTSTGGIIPQLIKFQDEHECVRTLRNFRIICQAEKNFCGIPTVEYECELLTPQRIFSFHLLFYIEQKEWKLWWKTPPS